MAEKDQEYAAMHFGFTAGAFADTIFNIGNEAIAAQLKTFKKEMQKKVNAGLLGSERWMVRGLTHAYILFEG